MNYLPRRDAGTKDLEGLKMGKRSFMWDAGRAAAAAEPMYAHSTDGDVPTMRSSPSSSSSSDHIRGAVVDDDVDILQHPIDTIRGYCFVVLVLFVFFFLRFISCPQSAKAIALTVKTPAINT